MFEFQNGINELFYLIPIGLFLIGMENLVANIDQVAPLFMVC